MVSLHVYAMNLESSGKTASYVQIMGKEERDHQEDLDVGGRIILR
jgi:hypothetical protein